MLPSVLRGAVQTYILALRCREALLRSAAGPEAFLAMRANFMSSLAAVSVSSYVAGVGDRHLQVQAYCRQMAYRAVP